ncbi:ABC transporter substrate-binding protein [Pseudomonas sp. GV071]|uniref:substrate-binding periplasmic protein n=1 Tax=Pseudomonas sp. GV071 TaxID=2135754 RepID=UPI000D368C12|nr:transporter substrate-binding domain-containing protein [Pseudomonas sp. GV071]PTQ70979.1 amino acid ABC transporter substrate-binding protein (PAAT family) [Pseudomonas sp. GV071]
MRGVWLAVLIGMQVVCAQLAQAAQPTQIRLASEVWAGHTNADGSGLAWDILRAVFEPVGVSLKIHSVPYTRSVGLVQRGGADAWVGSYLNEIQDGVFYPHWNYDADHISALGLRDAPEATLQTIGRYRLAWVRGYAYDKYLPNLTHYQEVYRRDGILSMLDMKHIDFYLDARTEVQDVLNEAEDKARYRVIELTKLPLFLGFADTPDGHALATLFDARMELLVKDGSLRPLFERWQQPYPFD